ncbi:lin1 family [Lecanosticta acicola]|uniref:Lin1 family n=1 Tax=Lecanosticta acicola TaxID=111012 RepID=A0AAI8YSX7_9PEZI|nr:lin1 family [Lecanosticta acicola]
MANTTSAARPKRAGEDFARSHDNTSKKPRFDYRNPSTLAADAPEEDLILDADVIGKSGAQTKRNAVNIDGYESDSDNDNFNARAAEKEKRRGAEKKSLDEEDDDMFADLEEKDGDEDEERAREGKKGRKDVRFQAMEEIEGQVMNSKSGGHVSSDLLMGSGRHQGKRKRGEEESESESSGDDSDRDRLDPEMETDLAQEIGAGGKKKHAPRLDAFNLRAEEDEGRFDASGNFVRKAVDPDAANDNWLEGLRKKDMRRAREAQEKREDDLRRKAIEDDAVLTSDLLDRLIGRLETGETPLEALARLNRGKTKTKKKEAKVPRWKLKRLQQQKENRMQVDDERAANGAAADDGKATLAPTAEQEEGEEKEEEEEKARKTAVEALTGAADALYSRGQHEIYEAERELLLRQYRRETGEDWKPAPAPAPEHHQQQPTGEKAAAAATSNLWHYRWSDARDGGEAHGPYDGGTMKAWHDAGYFGEGVEFRRDEHGEWSRLLDIT